jgi:hypothetical protein
VASAIRGKRGQEFLKKLMAALDAMPVKELVANDLQVDGEYCTMGLYGAAYVPAVLECDTEEHDVIADLVNVAPQLVQEVMFLNDEGYFDGNSEFDRRPYAEKMAVQGAARWKYMRNWAESNLKKAGQS